MSLDQTIGDGDGELGDLFADRTVEEPIDLVEISLEQERVREALERLPERERQVMEMRFGFTGREAVSLEEIGAARRHAAARPPAGDERVRASRAAARHQAAAVGRSARKRRLTSAQDDIRFRGCSSREDPKGAASRPHQPLALRTGARGLGRGDRPGSGADEATPGSRHPAGPRAGLSPRLLAA